MFTAHLRMRCCGLMQGCEWPFPDAGTAPRGSVTHALSRPPSAGATAANAKLHTKGCSHLEPSCTPNHMERRRSWQFFSPCSPCDHPEHRYRSPAADATVQGCYQNTDSRIEALRTLLSFSPAQGRSHRPAGRGKDSHPFAEFACAREPGLAAAVAPRSADPQVRIVNLLREVSPRETSSL